MNHQTQVHNEVNPIPYFPSVPPTRSPQEVTPTSEPAQPTIHIETQHTWQYKTVVYSLAEAVALTDEALNKFGAEGWELCSVYGYGDKVCFYFKR